MDLVQLKKLFFIRTISSYENVIQLLSAKFQSIKIQNYLLPSGFIERIILSSKI